MPDSLPRGLTDLGHVMWGSPTVAVAILDEDGRITAANPSFMRLAGGNSVDTSLVSYVCEAHIRAFDTVLAQMSGRRESACIGMFPDLQGTPTDVTLTVTKSRHVEVIIEPHAAESMGMLADVVTLNELLTHVQRELSAKNHELATSLEEIKKSHLYIRKLEGILPICMNCRSVRNDSDDWTSLDSYLVEREAVSLSHSLCPGCAESFLQEKDVS